MSSGRFFSYSAIAALFLALSVLPVHAQDNVQVSFTADRTELTVGDRVQLALEIRHPAGYQVIIPRLGRTWGEFEVYTQSPLEISPNGDGTEITRQTIEVTLFTPGTFQTPALPITISDGEGKSTEQEPPTISLSVIPVLGEKDTDLRDVKPQAGLAVPPIWPWVVGGGLLAVLLAWVGWRLHNRLRRKRQLLPTPVVDNRLPYQVAYDELARIEMLGLPERGQHKAHYTLVTDCLRLYLEKQLQVRALDRTTWELGLALRQSDVSPDHVRRFIDLFSESDLVKFAKHHPELKQARQLIERARALVDLTKPIPQPGTLEEEEESRSAASEAVSTMTPGPEHRVGRQI